MDICQIGYDVCEFDSLRDLRIDIIGRVHFDNQDRFAIWMGSIGKAPEPCQQTSGCWHLTFDSFLNLDMGDDTNTKFLLRRVQTTFMTSKMRGDCWGTWLIMLGFMDLRWPRVCRRSTSVLFSKWLRGGHIRFFGFWMDGFGSVTQVCFGISVSNFMCMSFVAVGRSLTIVSYVAFKMAALWFWTVSITIHPIAHCHPLLWGGGILVDHWSTIC